MTDAPAGERSVPVLNTISEIVALTQTPVDLYLRIVVDDGDVEPRDPVSGYRLPGAPAWPLSPEPWWLDSSATWVARQLVDRSGLLTDGCEGRIIAGEVVGRYLDGQPLVAPAHAVGVVGPYALAEATTLYTAWRERML